jgi:threonylcarbamoyladenosine tRNA methylthiotransferase MtaB
VTAEADRTARAFIRRARRLNPGAKIVVTGCYAQRAPEEVAALKGVNAVIGNSHKGLAAETIVSLRDAPAVSDIFPASSLARRGVPIYVDEAFAHTELSTLPFAADAHQTRPNLKVQDGCGNRCSFCIIPMTRGPSRSVPLETCIEDARRFADGGGQELVLSGINLGRWGRDLSPAQSFVDLVAAILSKTSLPRLRISSVEPMDWTPALLALFREFCTGRHPRLAPHAHLPLQSGSDTILRRMHRRYRPWHYAERTAAIRAALPDAAIGADVMVGFPGETDGLFRESCDFIAAQPFTYLHLFPFSARPGTPGWELHREHPVSAEAIAERMAALRALAEEKASVFRRRFEGRMLSAVTLEGGTAEQTPALSANFLKVEIAGAIPANRMVEASISSGRGKAALAGRISRQSPAGAFASKS